MRHTHVFRRGGRRRVVADFDGGMVSSDAGALLLGETDKAIRLIDRFAACFRDGRHPAYGLHDCVSACNKGSSLFGVLRSSAFEPSPGADVLREPALLFGIGSAAVPSWDQKNEVV